MDRTAKDDFSKALYIVHHNWDSVNCFVDKYNDWATKCESFLNFLANNRRKPLDESLLPSPLYGVIATVMVTLCLLESIRCNDVSYLFVVLVFLALLLLMSFVTSIVIVFVTRFDRPSKKSINFVMEMNEALIEESRKLNNFRKTCGLDPRTEVLHSFMLLNDPYVSVYSSFTDLLLQMFFSWYHFFGVLLAVTISFQFHFFQIDIPFDTLSFASICVALLLALALDMKISSYRKKIDISAFKFHITEFFGWFQKCRLISLLDHLHLLSNVMDVQKKSNQKDKGEVYLKHIAILVEATHEVRCKLNYVDLIERFTFHPNKDYEYFSNGIEDISSEKNTLHVDINAIRALVDDLLEFTSNINSPTNSLYFDESTSASQNGLSKSVTETKIIDNESVSIERSGDLKEPGSPISENSENSLVGNETIASKENTSSISENCSSKLVTEATLIDNESALSGKTKDLKEETISSSSENSEHSLDGNEIIYLIEDICTSQNVSSKTVKKTVFIHDESASGEETGGSKGDTDFSSSEKYEHNLESNEIIYLKEDTITSHIRSPKSVTGAIAIDNKSDSDGENGNLNEETGSSSPENSELCLDGNEIINSKDDTSTSHNGSSKLVTEATTIDNKSASDEKPGELKEETGFSSPENSELGLDGNEIINSKDDTSTSRNGSFKSVTEATTIDNNSALDEKNGVLTKETGSSSPENSELCLDGNEIINSKDGTSTSHNGSSKSITEVTIIDNKSAANEKSGELKEETGFSSPENSELCLDGNQIINSKVDTSTSHNGSSKSLTEATTIDNKSASDEETGDLMEKTGSSSPENSELCLDGNEIINSKDDTSTSHNGSPKLVTNATAIDNKSASDEKTGDIKEETGSYSQENSELCLDGKEIINSKDDTNTSYNGSSKSVTEGKIDNTIIKFKGESKRKLEDSSVTNDTSLILGNAQTETLNKKEKSSEDSQESGNTNCNVNFKFGNGPFNTTGLGIPYTYFKNVDSVEDKTIDSDTSLPSKNVQCPTLSFESKVENKPNIEIGYDTIVSQFSPTFNFSIQNTHSGELSGRRIFEFGKSPSSNLGDNHQGIGSASFAKSTRKLKSSKGKENGKSFNLVLAQDQLFTEPQKFEKTHGRVTDDSKPVLPLLSANNSFTLSSESHLPSFQPSEIANEEMKNQTLIINEHLSGLEKENKQVHHPPQKIQTAPLSIQTDEFTPEFPDNENKTTLIDSSTAISNADPNIEANTNSTNRPIEEISICTSQPTLDSKSEEKSKSSQNTLHAGGENQNVKNKHKNGRIRSFENEDFDLKDMDRTHKSYDSLCSSYVFKTKDSSVFVKNVCKENPESVQGEVHTISNVQKISNGTRTCVLQSSTSMVCISEPEHYNSLGFVDEQRHYSFSNEEKTLSERENLPFVKADIQYLPTKGKDDIPREIVEDTLYDQSKIPARKPASSRTGKKRSTKRKQRAVKELNYRSKQGESYSTEDTDQEDHRRNQSTDFGFAEGQIGWVDMDSAGSQEEEHPTDREEISDSFSREGKQIIRQSSLRSQTDIKKVDNLPLEKPNIQLIEEDLRYKQNGLTAKNSPKHKKKKTQKKTQKYRDSNGEDYADISDSEGSPQKGFDLQSSHNQNLTYGKSYAEDSVDDIEQDFIAEEEPNSELLSSGTSTYNFSSENYNLKFSECSSFVLVMGNPLGKYSGMSSSMETLCSIASERRPLTETSRNDDLELSQKLKQFSLQDHQDSALVPTAKSVPATTDQEKENARDDQEGSKSDHDNQVAAPDDENGVESDQEFNFSVGDLRFDFTPSPQLKAQKVVYKQSQNQKRFLFRSNEGGLYLETKK